MRLAALPKDLFISVEQQAPGNLDPAEWRLMVALVKLIRSSAPEGTEAMPSDIAPVIEHAIRGFLAKPVESTEMRYCNCRQNSRYVDS
jgi:hypothetical protein